MADKPRVTTAQWLFNFVRVAMAVKIRTRDGRLVRLTRWEVWDDSPIHGIIDGEEMERFWMADGRYLLGGDSEHDLALDGDQS